MRTSAILIAAAALASACSGDGGGNASSNEPSNQGSAGSSGNQAGSGVEGAQWDLQSSGEGVALALVDGSGDTVVRLFCAAGADELLVNVPAFLPVGSEERMSFGSGGEVVALVADSRGDAARGGVSATGAAPTNLAELIAGPIAVNYGAQNSGPHAAPPAQHARAFAAACSEGRTGAPPEPRPDDEPDAAPPQPAGACQTQDGRTLPAIRLRAIGTEPFWGARIEGRCVTYSHPENQSGTRIWTKFSGTARSGTWTGFYENQRFVLTTRPQAGCSDGMSDNRYPIAVSLDVAGERRTGCAEPL